MDNQTDTTSQKMISADEIERVYPILILQSNLQMLRNICGLTKRDFGSLVGVSGQTLTNLEKGCNSMSLMCYGAIMYFLSSVTKWGACGIDEFGKRGIDEAVRLIPKLNSPEALELKTKYTYEDDIMAYADSIKEQIRQIYIKTKTCRSEYTSDRESASDMIKRLLERGTTMRDVDEPTERLGFSTSDSQDANSVSQQHRPFNDRESSLDFLNNG